MAEALGSPTGSSREGVNLREVTSGIVAVLVEEPSSPMEVLQHGDSAPFVRPTAPEDTTGNVADGVHPQDSNRVGERRSVSHGMESSVSPSEVSAVHLAQRSTAVPMRHRHQLPPTALERGRELVAMSGAMSSHAMALLPSGMATASPAGGGNAGVASSSMTIADVIAEVSDLLSVVNPVGGGQQTTTPTGRSRDDQVQGLMGGSGGEALLLSANHSFQAASTSGVGNSQPTHAVTNTSGVLRSDVDDALIMQRLAERQRLLQELAVRAASARLKSNAAASGSESGADDAEMIDVAVQPPPPPNGTRLGVANSGGGAAAAGRVSSAHRNIQDDVFLESLNLVALDESIDWENPATFERRTWSMQFQKRKVERDFLRYEMQHHRFQPLLIYASVVFVVMLGVTIVDIVLVESTVLAEIWGSMLGGSVVLLMMVLGFIRYTTAALENPSNPHQQQQLDLSASSIQTELHRARSAQLRAARLAETAAFALCLLCTAGTLSSYSYFTDLCYRTSFYYVPWIDNDCNATTAASIAALLQQGKLLVDDNSKHCVDLERYCQQALFPFLVPSMMTSVILFRPRAFLAVPLMLLSPGLYAAGRYLTTSTSLVDTVSNILAAKLALVFVIAVFGSAVKIALEREQRRRFNAYAVLYCRLSQYVRSREALAEFLDAKVPPLLRTRLLSGNLSLDFSASATCVLFDISEFPTWCTKMLPLAAATSVMQLHDVLSARCATMGVERIRSLGDVFVAASNLSVACSQHAALCCQLAIQVFSDVYEFRHAFSAPVALRCGMHSGQLIGLVLGSTYRRYDVMGDALAIAMRVLDVTHANQVVITKTTCDLADEFVLAVDRSLTGGGSSDSGSACASHRGSFGAITEISNPFSNEVLQLRMLAHLKKVVPYCSAYLSQIKDNLNSRDRMSREKRQWASNVNRVADDMAQSSTNDGDSKRPATSGLKPPSQERRTSYTQHGTVEADRGTFDIVRPQPLVIDPSTPTPTAGTNRPTAAAPSDAPSGGGSATPQPEVSLVPAIGRGTLADVGAIRDFIIANNTSTALLERAISETRMIPVWVLQKHFASDVHEIEFSLSYLKAVDRIPFVTAQTAFVCVYLTMIGIILIQSANFPAASRSDHSSFDMSTISGTILLGVAAIVATVIAIVVYFSPNAVSESQAVMWVLVCAMHAFSMFGVTTSAPGVAGSDASYLFFLALIAMQFGSWSLTGFAMISLVTLGVFLAATNTTEGTFLPVWTLVMLAIASILNLYFDRNRERRLREMYRDLFLAKAAAKAVQAESTVRRSVLRATLPRPLFSLCMDTGNIGKMLTTSVTDGIVAQLRLDGLQDEVVVALSGECEARLRDIQEGRGEVQALGRPTSETNEPQGNIIRAIGAVHRSTEILERLIDAMTGTELSIVQAFGDWITIAGPLEEVDTRGDLPLLPVSGQPPSRKSRHVFERRLQQAAYDVMLLLANLFALSNSTDPFPFSAALVCDTVINVLANGEYPSYDLLGAGGYISRALLQQLSPKNCVATERFVEQYLNEMRLVAEEAAIPDPLAVTQSEMRVSDCGDDPTAASTAATPRHDGPPHPRIGERQRWRVRGLGPLWVHNIFSGSTLAGPGSPRPPPPEAVL